MSVKSSPPTLLVILLTAAACATPPPRCAGPEREELATIELLIAETKTTLERGYALETEVPDSRFSFCLGGRESNVGLSLCTRQGAESRPKTIDASVERRKLAALEARRQVLQTRITQLCPQQ